MGGNYAYKQIAAYEVTENLSSSVYNCTHSLPSPEQMAIEGEPVFRLPQNESQIRPLVGLDRPVQLEIWQEVCQMAGPEGRITGAMVAKAVNLKNRKDAVNTLDEVRTGARRTGREKQVNEMFKRRYMQFLEELDETIANKFRDTSKKATLIYLDGLMKVRDRIEAM